MSRTVLITGATGAVSTALLNALEGSDLKLRGLVRDPSKAGALEAKGVEAVVGDLDDPGSLAAAFDRVDDVWVLNPASPRAPENSMNALWAARQAGVKRVVRMSAVGAAHDAPTRNGRLHALSDHEVQFAGMRWTILRPHFFMQNLLGSAAGIASDGAFYLNMGEGSLGMIDVRDIGEAAAKVLSDDSDWHDGKVYTLTGPESITFSDAAKELEGATGRAVTYIGVPDEAASEAMLGMGWPQWIVGMLVEYGQAYASGWGDFTTSDFRELAGRDPRSFADFARDHSAAFGGQAATSAVS